MLLECVTRVPVDGETAKCFVEDRVISAAAKAELAKPTMITLAMKYFFFSGVGHA
jgi:hypothetical protein